MTLLDIVMCMSCFYYIIFQNIHVEENAELEKARQGWEALETVQPGQNFHLWHDITFHICLVRKLLS